MAADPVDEAADRLYGLPFEDFIPERDARARELRKAGEKEAAAEVAKLPKPGQVAWAANQLARGGADELLEAGEALREAQLGGGGREALRAATAAERAAVDALVRSAPKPGGRALSRAARDRLRALLGAVARDESVREAFVAGRLVDEPSAGGAWPSGDVVAPASTSTPASKGGTKESGGTRGAARRSRGRSATRPSAASASSASARPQSGGSARRRASARRPTAAGSSAA